jgi:hypothetical protein
MTMTFQSLPSSLEEREEQRKKYYLLSKRRRELRKKRDWRKNKLNWKNKWLRSKRFRMQFWLRRTNWLSHTKRFPAILLKVPSLRRSRCTRWNSILRFFLLWSSLCRTTTTSMTFWRCTSLKKTILIESSEFTSRTTKTKTVRTKLVLRLLSQKRTTWQS